MTYARGNCSEVGCVCNVTVVRDDSKGDVLHLVRLDPSGAVIEKLVLPIDTFKVGGGGSGWGNAEPARALDLDIHGDKMAIGLLLESGIRVLRMSVPAGG